MKPCPKPILGIGTPCYDYPPHGGIAFGFDRWAMMLTHSESLREVIAYPKTQRAVCPLTGAPGEVSADQLDELFLAVKVPPKKSEE